MTVRVIPEGGSGAGASFSYDLDGGLVTDVPIQELEPGTYTVIVDSPTPSIASVRASSAVGPATDFAWFTSAQELGPLAQFTAAVGPNPVLHVYNPTIAESTVSLTPLDGPAVSVVVRAGGSVAVPLVAGTSYSLGEFDSLHAAVSLVGSGMLARYSVHPPGVGSSPITIYP